MQQVPEEVPAAGVHDRSGQVGEVEEEEVPGLAELPGWCSPCASLRGWAAFKMASRSTTSGQAIAVAQATDPPQS